MGHSEVCSPQVPLPHPSSLLQDSFGLRVADGRENLNPNNRERRPPSGGGLLDFGEQIRRNLREMGTENPESSPTPRSREEEAPSRQEQAPQPETETQPPQEQKRQRRTKAFWFNV
jgi:hypothetical protein